MFDCGEILELCEELQDIGETNYDPWMVGGDFNVILSKEEKHGGLTFTDVEAQDFASCIANCALTELKFKGSLYTWWNGRVEDDCIFKRLDKVIVNQEFQQSLPSNEVHHLIRQGSDHVPLHVICNSQEEPIQKPLKFMKFLVRHSSFKEVVRENWRIDFVGDLFVEFHAKHKRVKGALAAWSKTAFGDIFEKVATLEEHVHGKDIQFELSPT